MKRVLVIEDDPTMRSNLGEILELEGIAPLLAADGIEGIELAREALPDLILCDILMPGLDGQGVLATLRQDPLTAKIPFVFLTAKGDRSDVRSGMNLGADDYLIKPVKVDDLLATIGTRIERAQQHATFCLVFKSARPLESLGLSSREAEILFWIAQSKSNSETGTILGIRPATVKKHLEHIYAKLGVEGRNSATLRALEVLNTGTA